MYESYFHFDQLPFENTPDPSFFYGSEQHREALAALVYGVRQFKGFMLITGDVGTGKTLLAQSLKHEIDNSEDITKSVVIQISNPWISHSELFQELAYRLGIRDHQDYSTIEAQKVIQEELLKVYEAKGRVILILDEAQQIPEKTLEGVRLLSNMEVPQAKLVQIILLGQTEFNDILTRHSMRQLRQRVTLSRRLEPLSLDDTIGYIDHRVHVAGADDNPFSRASIHAIYEASGGSPRLINQICDNALITAFASKNSRIDKLVVAEVVADLPIVITPKVEGHAATNSDHSDSPAPVKQETLLQRLATERGIKSSEPIEEPGPAIPQKSTPSRQDNDTADANLLAQHHALLQAVNESTHAQVNAAKHSHQRKQHNAMPQWLMYILVSLVSVLLGLGATYFYLSSQAPAAPSQQTKTEAMPSSAPKAVAATEQPAATQPPASEQTQEPVSDGYQRVYQDPIERFKGLDSPRAVKEAFNEQNNDAVPANKVEEIRKRWGFDSHTDNRANADAASNTGAQDNGYNTNAYDDSNRYNDDRYGQREMNPQPTINTPSQASTVSMLASPVELLMKMDQPYSPLSYGSTISQVARAKYTTWNDTVKDIVILANPSLGGNLNAGIANQRIYLPNIHSDDLLTRSDNGSWYIYAGTYESRSRVNKLIQQLANRGINAIYQDQPRYQVTVYRAFIGPFNNIRDASLASSSIQFDAMPFVR